MLKTIHCLGANISDNVFQCKQYIEICMHDACGMYVDDYISEVNACLLIGGSIEYSSRFFVCVQLTRLIVNATSLVNVTVKAALIMHGQRILPCRF